MKNKQANVLVVAICAKKNVRMNVKQVEMKNVAAAVVMSVNHDVSLHLRTVVKNK